MHNYYYDDISDQVRLVLMLLWSSSSLHLEWKPTWHWVCCHLQTLKYSYSASFFHDVNGTIKPYALNTLVSLQWKMCRLNESKCPTWTKFSDSYQVEKFWPFIVNLWWSKYLFLLLYTSFCGGFSALLNVMVKNVATPLGNICHLWESKGFWEVGLMSRFCYILMTGINDSFFIPDLQLVNHQPALTWLKGRWKKVGWCHSLCCVI